MAPMAVTRDQFTAKCIRYLLLPIRRQVYGSFEKQTQSKCIINYCCVYLVSNNAVNCFIPI